MIKIWGRTDSSNVQKVLWCCDELGIPYQRIDIGGRFGGNQEKPYLDMNPNGLIPTIEDGGFVLWESNSIVRYLDDKYGHGKLLPSTPEGRAGANRWMDWQLTTLLPANVPLYWGYIRTPAEKRDLVVLENSRQAAIKVWKILDDHLTKNSYAAGDSFTMGDIPLGVWAHRWFNLPIERPEMPNVKAWYERLGQRPPYRTHVMLPLT